MPKARAKSKGGRKRAPAAAKTTPTALSWLDRLQQSAHASELDEKNTPPAVFCLLVAMQAYFAYTVSNSIVDDSLQRHFKYSAIVGVGSHWLGFAISILIGTCKYFDITEDLALLYMIVAAFVTDQEKVHFDALLPPLLRPPGIEKRSSRQTLVFVLSVLWCIRLGSFVGYRVLVRGRDFRFDKLMKGRAYNLFGWTSGGLWCWLNPFCLWVLAASKDASLGSPIGVVDYAGIIIFSFGLATETVADIQKYAFNAGHSSGKNKKFISHGLWSYSRHPNFFGENLVWLGLAIICSQGAGTYSQLLLVIISPIWSLVFLVFTSLMLLEKRGDATWGKSKKWQEYKASTPVLFPKSFPSWESYSVTSLKYKNLS